MCILFMLEMIKEFRLFRRIIYHRVWINLGDSLFYVVIMWVLYDHTRDPLYPSMGGFMFSLSDVLNFFCGPVIDRSDQGRLLVVSSGIQFLIAAALYLLSAKGCLSVWMLLPPRQMIGRVNTVNLSLMAIASLGGSLLGGVVVQKFNSVFPFLLCGLGYLAIAMTMRTNRLVYTLPKTEDMGEQILSVD